MGNNQKFDYYSEPYKIALIVAIVPLIAAIFVPLLIVRLIVFSCAVGPAVWAFIQWQRHRHFVTVNDDAVVVERPVTGWRVKVPYTAIRGLTLTPQNQLLIAYETTPPQDQAQYSQYALARTHESRPHRHLIIISGLNDPASLYQALALCVPPAQASTYPADVLLNWSKRLRIRRAMLGILALLGTPVYFVIIYRLFASFIR